jgi:hypothetical protein
MTENAAHRIISELVKTFKAVAMYPVGHPARSRFYDKLKSDFSSYLNEFGTLKYTVEGATITFEGEPIVTRDGAEQFLSTECFQRQINNVTFLRGVGDEDIDLFFTLLAMDPALLRKEGGAVEYLRGKGSGALQVEQTDYEGILERREEIDPADEGGYGLAANSPVQVPDHVETIQSPTPKVFADDGKTEISQEEWLTRKLAELDKAGSAGEYKTTLREIFTSLKSTGTLNMPEYSVLVLRHLGRHILAKAPEEIALITRAAVKELATYDTLDELAQVLTDREEVDRNPIYAVLDLVQQDTIPILLKRLAEEDEAFGRRTLMNALGRYGDGIRGHLEKWLTDERWYVVRNALGLLQQVGGPRDSQSVRTFLRYPNSKVRLEALRFLYRHPVPVDDALMQSLLDDEDPEVQARAIYALGVLQGEKGINRLLGIAKKPLVGEGDVARRVSAIKGVGRYGGDRAIQMLRSLLNKRGVMDSASSARVQKACVEALIESGDARVPDILKRALSRLKGPVFKQAQDYVNKHG